MTTHTVAPGTTVLEFGLWRAWTPLTWLLPPVIFGFYFASPNAGWEALAMLVSFPIWYPVLGLLLTVPKWIWRHRAGKTAQPPALLLACFVAFWASLVLGTLTISGSINASPLTPALIKWFPLLDDRAASTAFGLALLFALGSLTAAIIIAARARVDRPRSQRGWIAVPCALLILPVAVLIGLGVQISSMNGIRDAAGRNEFEASLLNAKESIAQENAAWDEVQQTAVPLRSVMSKDGWLIRGGSGLGSDSRSSGRQTVTAVWEARSDAPIEELVSRARATLERGGWKPDPAWVEERDWMTDDPSFTESKAAYEYTGVLAKTREQYITLGSVNSNGTRASYTFWLIPETGKSGLEVTVEGPAYWAGPLGYNNLMPGSEEFDSQDLVQPSGGYAASEWPSLAQVENSSIMIDLDVKFPGE